MLVFARGSTACQSLEVPLKPLNLHQKVHELSEDLILSTLTITAANLTISDLMEWVSNILPDVPSIVDQAKSSIKFIYKSSFLGSYLSLNISHTDAQGEIIIQSDNYSVLTIMKVSQVCES